MPIDNRFADTLNQIVARDDLHALWINTLSLMENAGARKISAIQDRQHVELEMLRHAAEEARHAFFLKWQLRKVTDSPAANYAPSSLLAPMLSRQLLHRLDIQVSRYLRDELGLSGKALIEMAYLLVTHAIEVRASEMYPVYQQILRSHESEVSVTTIIAEENGHLEEMQQRLEAELPNWREHAQVAQKFEQELFETWFDAVHHQIGKESMKLQTQLAR